MSRPDFLNCIMPVNVIRRIKQEQDCYDDDPERYERQQQEHEQQLELEREQERAAWDE